MSKDKTFLTSTEKRAIKEQKKRKGIATLVLLFILSLALNVFLLLQGTLLPKFSIIDKIPFLDMLTADNTEFEEFIDKNNATFDFSVTDSGTKTEYLLFNKSDKSTLWIIENDNLLSMVSCDFTIDKWNEMRALLLKRQLHWYNESEHVDSVGRILDRNDKYVMNLGKYSLLSFYGLETPKNSAAIEKFFVQLAADANASPDKKIGKIDDNANQDFVGFFETISVSYEDKTYTISNNGHTCEFVYKDSNTQCRSDFVVDRMEDVKDLLLSNALEWADDEEEVDADGKITYVPYESPYSILLYDDWSIVGKRIKTPNNIDKIITYLDDMAQSAMK